VPEPTCCAQVDFKLKQKWPHKLTQVGTFNITNLDPSSPICKVEISTSPSGTFSPVSLVVDGVSSSQIWNSSLIPASGSLTSPAVNTISFSMSSVNYSGIVKVCVVKCDGTRCCFDFKWNTNPIINVDISVGQLGVDDKLVAIRLNPKVTSDLGGSVKYVAFGFSSENEVKASGAEFFAISSTKLEGDEYPDVLTAPISAFMSKYNAFFELSNPVATGGNLGAFNLVFTKKLPALGCTLFDEEGSVVFSGEIDVTVTDTIVTSVITPLKSTNLFEFINVYPNPSTGVFNLTYATSDKRDVEIKMINALGQTIEVIENKNSDPGIHTVVVDANYLPQGLYKFVIYSNGEILSKSAVKK
jgi:hypothetical protein